MGGARRRRGVGFWLWAMVSGIVSAAVGQMVMALISAVGAIPVYRRLRQPCRRCGTAIKAGTVGAGPRSRTLFFCPRCQA